MKMATRHPTKPLQLILLLTLISTPSLASSSSPSPLLPPKTCPFSPLPLPFLPPTHALTTSLAPVDDESPPTILSSSPWTSPPYCLLFSTPLATSPPDPKLCVYIAATYNHNAGISIIGHPDSAATLVQAIRDPRPAYHARQHIARSGNLAKKEKDDEGRNELKYIVTTIPGKGKGVIATKHISQFETILTSFPAMVVDNELFPADEDEAPAEGVRLFRRALGGLTDRGRFLGLARSRGTEDSDEDGGGDGEGRVHVVEDVIRTNAFGIYTVDGRDYKGLYPEIARLNHGCDPNAYSRYTKGDLAMSAVATRDIEPGEEITISYIPLGMPSCIRHKALFNWGFTCTCPLCSSPAHALQASDSRRERIATLYHTMRQLQPDPTSPATHEARYERLVSYTKEIVELVQIEGLFPKVAEYYQGFMEMYYEFGDVGSAVSYARTALRFAEVFSDPEGGFCGGLRGDLSLLEELLGGVKEEGGVE